MLEWDSEWSGRNGIQVIVEVSERAANANSTNIEGKIYCLHSQKWVNLECSHLSVICF